MNRFRPNLVVTGTKMPFEEDAWEAFVLEGASHAPCKFLATIPCDRCKVVLLALRIATPTPHALTGHSHAPGEPMLFASQPPSIMH
jgi:uncharacterized protein YcbX